MRSYILLLITFILLFPALGYAEEDYIQCTENDRRVLCNLHLPNYIQSAHSMISNGWENTLQINISLTDSSGSTVLQRSRLEATQRCYLDPFESPCLILWKGASHWQRYRDDKAFIKAMSHFGIQALTLKELPPDNYIVQIEISIFASASKRLNSIRSWFRQNASESGNFLFGNNSLISSFLSSRAESAENSETLTATFESAQFYIDIGFNKNKDESEDSEDEN